MELTAVAVAADVLVMACCIYVATKLVFLDAPFSRLLAIVMVVSLISLIPYAGWVLGACVFVYLLMSATGTSLLRCALVVMVTRLAGLATVFFIMRAGQA